MITSVIGLDFICLALWLGAVGSAIYRNNATLAAFAGLNAGLFLSSVIRWSGERYRERRRMRRMNG